MAKVLVKNKKATYEYELLNKFEAGMLLKGHEVKSLRNGGGNLSGSYVTVRDGELWVEKMKIRLYDKTTMDNYEPERSRKLLVHRRQIDKIIGALNTKGVTLVPLFCILKHGKIKLEFALARGKKKYDKRESIKKRDQDRQIRREVNC